MPKRMKVDLVSIVLIGVLVLFFAFGAYRVATREPYSLTLSGIFLPPEIGEELSLCAWHKWAGQDHMNLGKGYFYTFSTKTLYLPDGSEHNVTATRNKNHIFIDVR